MGSNFWVINGQGLQRRYSKGVSGSGILSKADLERQKKDMEALHKMHVAKRAKREARMEARMKKNMSPEKALQILEENPTADIDVEKIQQKALEQTNVIARKYGLAEPNNPEALKHDRFHCSTCDRRLDQPNAHKGTDVDGLFDDADIRLLCCWCFGKMSDSEIKSTMRIDGAEASAEIRLKVYNPIESTKEEIESLVDTKRIYLKAKLKKWQQDTELIGKFKYSDLAGEDFVVGAMIDMAKASYNYYPW